MSDSLLLTALERERFAAWLEREAETEKSIITQLEKLSVPEVVITKKKSEIAAYLIVARILRNTIDWTVE